MPHPVTVSVRMEGLDERCPLSSVERARYLRDSERAPPAGQVLRLDVVGDVLQRGADATEEVPLDLFGVYHLRQHAQPRFNCWQTSHSRRLWRWMQAASCGRSTPRHSRAVDIGPVAAHARGVEPLAPVMALGVGGTQR